MSSRVVRSRAERLAGYRRVREARNFATSPDRLRELAADPILPVRVWTARNPNTPSDSLASLALGDRTQWFALHNPGTPAESLRRVARNHYDEWGRQRMPLIELVIHHPNAPDDLRDEYIAVGACANPRYCPSPERYG